MKNSKKIIIGITIFVFVLIACFLICNIFNKKKIQEKSITPILYEVTKEGSANKMYLFGSIHLGNKDEMKFPNYVLNAYNNSHYIACEYNMVMANADFENAQKLVMKMMYSDGTTIKDHINEVNYNKIVNFLKEKNSYNQMYDYYKPVFFYSLMSNVLGNDAKIDSQGGVDEYFINKAIEDKKTILEVESMDYQMNLLFEFSDNLYETAIIEMIDNYDDEVKGIFELYNNWKQGNEDKILELNDSDIDVKDNYSIELKNEINSFNQKLINDRNKTMTDKAIEYFNNNQDVFFMVGTLHIIGDDGIANNLKEQGYVVKRIQ